MPSLFSRRGVMHPRYICGSQPPITPSSPQCLRPPEGGRTSRRGVTRISPSGAQAAQPSEKRRRAQVCLYMRLTACLQRVSPDAVSRCLRHYQALRLPVMHPFDLVVRQPMPRVSCNVTCRLQRRAAFIGGAGCRAAGPDRHACPSSLTALNGRNALATWGLPVEDTAEPRSWRRLGRLAHRRRCANCKTPDVLFTRERATGLAPERQPTRRIEKRFRLFRWPLDGSGEVFTQLPAFGLPGVDGGAARTRTVEPALCPVSVDLLNDLVLGNAPWQA